MERSLADKYVYEYALEVVANGSEQLEPTIFLSVSRRSKGSFVQACKEPDIPDTASPVEDESLEAPETSSLTKYAVLGLSDMTARLVADQKFSWANTAALFCHNNHRHCGGRERCPYAGVNGGGLWGLPGLLLALNQAGASEVTVVNGNEKDASCTEAIVALLEANKSHPRVRISAVPLTKQNDDGVKWWKLYEDPYLIVHGTCAGRLEHLVYLFTCRKHETVPNYTLAVLPCPHSWQVFLDLWGIPEKRILLEVESNNVKRSEAVPIGLVLAVGNDCPTSPTFLSQVEALLPEAAVFFCRSQERDIGILLRATEFVETWSNLLPKHIMWRKLTSSSADKSYQPGIVLRSLASSTSVVCAPQATVVDRRTAILKRTAVTNPSTDDVNVLKTFFGADAVETNADENEIDIDDLDEEECDLKGKDDSGVKFCSDTDSAPTNAWLNCPYLLVLGTGCAAPSPLRGSSAYGLLLPQVMKTTESKGSPNESNLGESLLLTAVFECGEGTLSMLLRHLPSLHSSIESSECLLDVHLRHVKFIWISHAHWDHYGGLPACISKIYEARMRYHRAKQQPEHFSSKRSRAELSEPPVLVVAPRKVIDYLNITLYHSHDDVPSPPLFQGYTHEHFQSWWPALASTQIARVSSHPNGTSRHANAYRPFHFWTNSRVEHSCYEAFGFVCGIKVPRHNFAGDICGISLNPDQADVQTLTLAYSGDTRPCWSFVQQCLRDCSAFNNGILSYLIHEATFDDADQAKSIAKKHTSLTEALKVAEDAQANKVILTHFSQRYVEFPPMPVPASLRNSRPILFAMDGTLIPLQLQRP